MGYLAPPPILSLISVLLRSHSLEVVGKGQGSHTEEGNGVGRYVVMVKGCGGGNGYLGLGNECGGGGGGMVLVVRVVLVVVVWC